MLKSEMEQPLWRADTLRNLDSTQLLERAVDNNEGVKSASGALVVQTAVTGRTPDAKGIVDNNAAAGVDFGKVNKPVAPEDFDELSRRASRHLSEGTTFQSDLLIRIGVNRVAPVKFFSENAGTSLFVQNLFVTPEQASHMPNAVVDIENRITITHVPSMSAGIGVSEKFPERAIVTKFDTHGDHQVVVAGTDYAGENKKSVFSALQHLLPDNDIATMHCSANKDELGNTTLLFGLSGTGKTTLSSDPSRILIGDDEHGWSDDGVFNFEGGSYAKLINLDPEKEPAIWDAVHGAGVVLENVQLDQHNEPIFSEGVENMRGAYSMDLIPFADEKGSGDHPNTIVFLTADGSGAFPAVAMLTPEQAMNQFLSGYTSAIPGTEAGVAEPTPTFSACYGAPFLARSPVVYKDLLEQRVRKHKPTIWVLNTGWQGGFEKGQRISISKTRRILDAIQNDQLENGNFEWDPLGFRVPSHIQGIEAGSLHAATHWGSREEYEQAAKKLANDFKQNFQKFGIPVGDPIHEGAPIFRASP